MKTLFTAIAISIFASVGNPKVYVTQSGSKYHTHKDCRSLKKSNSVQEISLEEAQKSNKTICHWCELKDSKPSKD